MDALLSVNWIALLVLMIALLSFKALNWIAYRVNWTVVILISILASYNICNSHCCHTCCWGSD